MNNDTTAGPHLVTYVTDGRKNVMSEEIKPGFYNCFLKNKALT